MHFIITIIVMITLPPFHLLTINIVPSISPPPSAKHMVLDFSENDATGLDWRGFHSNRDSSKFNQMGSLLDKFDRWHQKQCQIYSIEILLAHTWVMACAIQYLKADLQMWMQRLE